MLHRLLDQIGEQQSPRGLQTIDSRCFATTHALEKMLQLGIERFNRRGADLFNESVIAIKQLTVIGGIPLMGTTVDMQSVIEKIGLHKA